MKKVTSDSVYRYIREKILDGTFLPGDPLATEMISKATGTSRTPVREALHRLKADGLVSMRANAGASVKVVGPKEFIDLCDLRLALESHAACLAACRHTSEDLARIKFSLDGMKDLIDRLGGVEVGDSLEVEMGKEDVQFHIAIMDAARNDLLKSEILRLHLLNRVVYDPHVQVRSTVSPKWSKEARNELLPKVFERHTKIFDAIAARNGNAARNAMQEHIQEIIDMCQSELSPGGRLGASRVLTDDELVYGG